MSPRMLVIITTVITLAWIGNVVIGWIDPTRRQDAVSAAFMFVIAILYRRIRRGRDDDPPELPPTGARGTLDGTHADAPADDRQRGDQP